MDQAEKHRGAVEPRASRTAAAPAREDKSAEKPSRASEDPDADALVHAIVHRLVAVEEWCARHSEYFLG